MANRIITASVSGESIKLSNKVAGAAGSCNAVSLSLSFDGTWDGTTKKVYFFDVNGGNAVVKVLTADLLTDGAYLVPIPAEPIQYAGEMTLTIKGVELAANGTTAERVMMSATTTMKVLSATVPSSDTTPVEPNATQTEQLQSEIDALTSSIVSIPTNVAAAEASATAAAGSAAAAEASKTAAAQSATSAAGSATTASEKATSASGSATAAANSATDADASKTAASNSASGAATSEGNAEISANTATAKATAAAASEANALIYKTAAETAKTDAINAKDAAITAKTAAETAKTAAETAQGAAETAQAGAEAAQSAAETAEGTATIKATEAGESAANALIYKTAAESAQALAETAKTGADSAKTAAQSAQTAAEGARDTAVTAKDDAVIAKTAAQTAQTNAETAEAHAETAEANATAKATLSQSYAIGGTGTRSGEDTDNAKYYKEQAAAIVGGDYPTKTEAQGYVDTHDASGTAHATLFGNKVDKVSGKGLSTNDYDATEKSKVANALPTTGDGSNVTAVFTQATTRANIATGEKLSVLFGKIKKYFADLGTMAFKSTVAKTDLETAVQTSLGKADTALQSFTETDPTVPAWAKAASKPAYTKAEVGLSNVDNTADSAKPVSTAQQTALDGKANTSHTHTKSQITDFPTSMTPAAHKASHSTGGADALTPANIGAATKYSGTATLTVAGWTGTAAPFTQAVTCAGILATDTPAVDCVTGTDAAAGAAIVEAWGLAVGAGINPQTSAGTITFYASKKPAVAVPFRWEGTR